MSVLPAHYERWLRHPDFQAPALDCASCEGVRDQRFHAAVKCCTYFPFLPNFTLGALLESSKRDQVRSVMAQGALTPLGLFAPIERETLVRELGPEAFGRAAELVCPFLQGGACSIWTHRPGVCASYFCRPTAGSSELESELNRFEWTLAHEVLWRDGLLQDEIEQMERLRAEGRAGEAWFEHKGREEEFFLRMWARSKEVTPAEIAELLS